MLVINEFGEFVDASEPKLMKLAHGAAVPVAGGFHKVCRECGKAFTAASMNRAYCSDACKSAANRRRARDGEQGKARDLECAWCGKPFRTAKRNKLYCSPICKSRANAARSRERGKS